MPENEYDTDSTRSEHKFFGKHRWRGKLFSNEEKTSKNDELQGRQVNDVVEFLQTPTDRASSRGQPKLKESSPALRESAASGAKNSAPQLRSHSGRKPPRREGPRVTFDSAEPEIIGEGGDEAVLPSIDVRRSQQQESHWQQLNPPNVSIPKHSRRLSPPVENEPNLRWSLRWGLENEGSNDDDDSLRSPPLQKQSTGFHGLEQEEERFLPDQDTKRQRDLRTMSLGREESMLSPGSDSNSESFAAIYASYAQDSPQSPDIVVEQSAPQSDKGRLRHKDEIEDLKGFSTLKPFSPEFDTPFGNSLTPIPSPQPITTQAAQSSSYNFPSPISKQRSPSQVEEMTRQYQNSATGISGQAVAPNSRSSSPAARSPPISLRNVARTIGDDAFNSFLIRIERFNSIFRLGATASRSFESITFMQWMRAATWWFLKGRGELESTVRGRPRSSDRVQHVSEADVSKDLEQAYLNLAKACWILMEIVPKHEELKKYGNASIGSLSPIIRSFGDVKLAEMLDLHHAIIANMRALTMSMKRNNKMPSGNFEPQGLDTRVWVETPRFASGVAGLLSGTTSRKLLEDESAGFDAFPYPVGDTLCYFNYGSMFVDVVLESSGDSKGGVHLSCILTILRQRTDRELNVNLASQDGQVNLVIQSDPKAGPTWRNAHWKTNNSTIMLELADGLGLEIQFREQNFRSLWGIYDYTRKVRKEMEPDEAEELVFRATVRCVHYVDSPDAKVFPLDPVPDCDVILFEKNRTLTEGNGRRRFYNGHRLVVVTPPGSKTLSSTNQGLGKQMPILFSYVRGEGDGPALLLKNEGAGSTIVITFGDQSSRDKFQTLLDGTLLREDESYTKAMPLRALDIGTSNEESRAGNNNFLSQWRWHELRVINRRPEFFENGLPKTVLSEHLRIWTQCEAGSFVDRMHLGTYFAPTLQLSALTGYRARRAANSPVR